MSESQLQREFRERDVQRMRNIIKKDYNAKTTTQIGYTKVHEMIEEYLEGKEMNFLNQFGNPQYDPNIWQMFLRFVDFWETYKPELIDQEIHLYSDELKVAGTTDLVCRINNELWIVNCLLIGGHSQQARCYPYFFFGVSDPHL